MEDFPHLLIVEAVWPSTSNKTLNNKLSIYFQNRRKSQGGECVVEFSDQTSSATVYFKSAQIRDQVLAKGDHSVTIENQLVKLKIFKPEDEEGLTEEAAGAGSDAAASFQEPVLTEQKISSVRVDNIPADAGINKDLLEDYFEKWGGPIEIINPIPEEQAAIITFQSPEAVERILDRADHSICMMPISVHPYYGLDVSQSDPTEEPLTSSSVVLENLADNISRMVLVLLVENISGLSEEEFFLELILESNIAVLTFNNPRDAHKFVMVSKTDKNFQKYELRGRALEKSTSVKVENLPGQTSTDLLELYFEKWGGPVNEITTVPDEQAAIITFISEEAIQKILGRENHISKTSVDVYPYFQSLGTALYGKDRPTWALPKPFKEKIHPAIREFLHKKGLIPTIHDQMASLFSQVDMYKSEVQISPIPTLMRQKGITKSQIDNWKQNATDSFRNILSRYDVFEHAVMPSVWATVEKDIQSVVKDKAFMGMDNGVLTLAGMAQDISILKPILEDLIQKVSNQMERDKNSVSDHMPMSPAMYLLLLQEGFQKTIMAKHPELKFMYIKDKNQLTFIGLPVEITDIKNWILEMEINMKEKPLEMDPSLLEFLNSVDCEEMSEDLFTSKGIRAVFRVENDGVILSGSTDTALRDAERILETTLTFSTLILEDLGVIEMPEWHLLSDQLCETFNTSKKKTVVIKFLNQENRIVVSGFKEPVSEVSLNLENLINTHSKIEEVFYVKTSVVVKFIQEKIYWQELVKLDEIKVHFDQKTPLIKLSGERRHVQPAMEKFQKMAEALHTDKLILNKPGAKKYFQEQRSMFLIMTNEHRFVVLLEESHIVEKVEEELGAYGEDRVLTSADLEDVDACTLNATAQAVREDFEDFNPTKTFLTSFKIIDNHGRGRRGPGNLGHGHRVDETVDFSPEERRMRPNLNQLRKTKSGDWDSSESLERQSTKEGLRIFLRKGNIQDESSDVIVNTIAENANLSQGAVSKALLQAAGPQLQSEALSQLTSSKLSPGDIVVTGGYNLNCQKVFHTVCPVWNKGADSEDEILKQIITHCLKKAEHQKMASISFPVIGTGNLRFPKELVASILLREINDFRARVSPRFLKEVTVVVHPSDTETVECFTKSFRRGRSDHITKEAPGLFGVVSSPTAGVHTLRVGHVTLEVSSGDITREESDAIVNSSNATFSLKSGVSKAILDAAGSEVELECIMSGLQQKDMIITSGGQLPCRHIIHIKGQNNPAAIKDVVYSVLKLCEAQKLSSVTFPALGTGQGRASPSVVAEAMIDGVVDFVNKKKGVHLQKVKFLIFQTSMMSDFHQSMLKRQQEGVEEEIGMFGRIKEKMVGYFSAITADPAPNEDLEIVTEVFDPAVFHLCGESQEDLNEARDLITSFITKEQMSTSIKDSAINHFTRQDAEMLRDLQRELTVSIRLKKKGPEPVISVEGLTRDVLKAENTIREIICRVERNETRRREAFMVGGAPKWSS